MAAKVILITGASAGLGKAFAEHLVGLGHKVYGTSRRAEFPAEEDAACSLGMIPMDVCDSESVRLAVNFVQQREGRLDVVVNNAGVGLAGAIEDTTIDEAKALFETNVFGMLRVCRAVLPGLREQGSGLIVNVSSLGGLVTIPFQGFYSASKYAVEAMSDALRMELRPFGVRIALLEPGDFKTDFTGSRLFAGASGEGSAYRERCARAVAVMERDEQGGADPRTAAILLSKIIEEPAPRNRYSVGALGQRLGVHARRLLPSSVLEKVVRAIYKV